MTSQYEETLLSKTISIVGWVCGFISVINAISWIDRFNTSPFMRSALEWQEKLKDAPEILKDLGLNLTPQGLECLPCIKESVIFAILFLLITPILSWMAKKRTH